MQSSENAAPQPQISLSVISEAFQHYKGNRTTWKLAAASILLLMLGWVFLTTRVIDGISKTSQRMPLLMQLFIPRTTYMMPSHPILIPFTFVFYISSFFLSAGLYRMAAKQIRGHQISLSDIIPTNSSEALSIFSFATVIWIFHTTCQLVIYNLWYQSTLYSQSPNFRALSYGGFTLQILLYITIGGLLMFTLPLIVDQQLKLIDAMTKSFNALKHQWLMAMFIYTAIKIIAFIGWFFFAVGILVTFPIAALSITLLYRNFFIGGSSPLPVSDKKLFEPAIPPGS